MISINKEPTGNGLYIKTLIDRYMAGETTNEEEATLRTWFKAAGDNVPKEWLPLKAMFSFIDSERDAQTENYAAPIHKEKHTLMRLSHKPRIWIYTAVAAAVVFAVLMVSPFSNSGGKMPQNYAVIDAKVYTNPAVVKENAMDALDAVSTDDDPFSALDMMQ